MLNNCYLGVIAANDAQPVHQLIKPIPDQIGIYIYIYKSGGTFVGHIYKYILV